MRGFPDKVLIIAAHNKNVRRGRVKQWFQGSEFGFKTEVAVKLDDYLCRYFNTMPLYLIFVLLWRKVWVFANILNIYGTPHSQPSRCISYSNFIAQ